MKGRKVVDLNDHRKETGSISSRNGSPGNGKLLKFSTTGPMSNARNGSRVAPSEVLRFLEKESGASIPKDLVDMMDLPGVLFKVGNKSFSSDDSQELRMLLLAIAQSEPIPRSLPGFGISINSQNGSLFATLADKRRRIIVHEEVSSPYGGSSWNFFFSALTKALEKAGEARDSRLPFSYVRTGSGHSKIL
jgi:hypothetical protein